MKITVPVPLGRESYDIVIGESLLARTGELIRAVRDAHHIVVVTDKAVAPHYLATVCGSLESKSVRVDQVVIEAGEGSKSFAQLEKLTDALLALRPDRRTLLVALGGGVVGDLTGFAASIVLRGLEYVQIPTTLLAQVDSAVGGKTGINTRFGKNLIGSFYQPRLVIADISALATLPRRQWRSGYAEIVKYGLINSEAFFDWLEKNGEAMLEGDAALLAEAVAHCCRAKAAVVGADEKEQSARALLNLGHTFGHALEAETGYSDALLHGEAVAIGMALAFRLSVRLGLCGARDAERVTAHLKKVGLPTSPRDIRPRWDTARLLQHCYHDKKAAGGKLTFILAYGIGKAFVATQVRESAVSALLAEEAGV